jgi:(p)ppGpp synthase/HD superfamily hydrolase
MLTSRFACALRFAERLHRRQTRKGSAVPYVAHLFSVCALVLEHGGDEDAAIAALLHDAVEDQGGAATARKITDRFGPEVAEIVLACTDALPELGAPKPPWRARKAAFIERMREAPPEVALVVTCDKLHNLRCILDDLDREGPATLLRFNTPAGLPWYYASLAAALEPHRQAAPVDRLQAVAQLFCGRLEGVRLPSRPAYA